MTELDKKIQEAKNEKQRLLNDISEQLTNLKVREAERRMMDSFIDELNDLKSKSKVG